MQQGQTWDTLPKELLDDLAQLTKANSIEGTLNNPLTSHPLPTLQNAGNKKDNITVIYTPWSNLKKDGSMDVGQVSFKDSRKVKRIFAAQRENPIVNRLNKTRVEKKPDLKQELDDHQRELRKRDFAVSQAKVCFQSNSTLNSFPLRKQLNLVLIHPCPSAEKGRGSTGTGVEGEKVAKGACLR
jgi:hypothetical protein